MGNWCVYIKDWFKPTFSVFLTWLLIPIGDFVPSHPKSHLCRHYKKTSNVTHDSGAEGWPRRLTRKPRAAADSRPVEAIARDDQVDKTNRVRRWTSERHSVTLTGFPWFSSVVRRMPGYSMQSRGTARTPLPQGAAASPKRLTSIA